MTPFSEVAKFRTEEGRDAYEAWVESKRRLKRPNTAERIAARRMNTAQLKAEADNASVTFCVPRACVLVEMKVGFIVILKTC